MLNSLQVLSRELWLSITQNGQGRQYIDGFCILENRVIWDCSLSMKPVVRLVTILMIQHFAKDDETPESAYEQVKRRYGPLALSEPPYRNPSIPARSVGNRGNRGKTVGSRPCATSITLAHREQEKLAELNPS